jgi:putative hydrolase of the HAD superfamily
MEDFGVGKPDPRMFRHACHMLGVAPSEAAYVGDELDVDARGARDAGLVGVWLDRHGTGRCPKDVPAVRSLDELPDLLRIPGAS